MSITPARALACVLTALALVLPACGGDEAAAPQPAPGSAPAEDLRVLERRVGGLEGQLRKLREEIESQSKDGRSSGDETGSEGASEAPAGGDTAGAPARGTSATAPGSAGGGSPADSGPGSGGGGSGSGGGGSRSGGGSGSGGGGSGSGGSEDPTIEDICGPNPAPEC